MKLKCKVCNGTGLIPNPDFEACRSWDWREWTGIKEGDCEHCPDHTRPLCRKGEQIVCYNCNGNGYMEIDENLWEMNEIKELVKDALMIEGGHHKQWYLIQIAKKLDIDLSENEIEGGIKP